jgi:hypothetical protein
VKSWKTTLAGIVTAIGAGLSQTDDPTLKIIGQILMVLGPIIFGVVAKDSNVHGGTVPQGTPLAVQAEMMKEGREMQ